MIILLVLIISCSNEKRSDTNTVKKRTENELNMTGKTDSTDLKKDSAKIITSENQHNQNSFTRNYKYGDLISRLKGNVSVVYSNNYYDYIIEDGKTLPDFDGDYWYNYMVRFEKDGKYAGDDFDRNSGSASFLKYKFDTAGNALKIAYYNWSDRDTMSIIKCSYDQQNNMLDKRYYEYMTGKPQYFTIYKYDDQNNLIQDNFYEADRVLRRKMLWSYDSSGNETTFTEYNFDNDSLRIEKKYKYAYEYDSIGNWIYQIVYENDKITHIEHRQIEYY